MSFLQTEKIYGLTFGCNIDVICGSVAVSGGQSGRSLRLGALLAGARCMLKGHESGNHDWVPLISCAQSLVVISIKINLDKSPDPKKVEQHYSFRQSRRRDIPSMFQQDI